MPVKLPVVWHLGFLHHAPQHCWLWREYIGGQRGGERGEERDGGRGKRWKVKRRGSKESRKRTIKKHLSSLATKSIASLTPSLCMHIETNLAAVRSRVTWLSHPEASSLPNQLELVISEGSLHAVRREGGGERGKKGKRSKGERKVRAKARRNMITTHSHLMWKLTLHQFVE